MKYTMRSHETEYAGVRFRSRLEARWACFFDLVDWKWEYEPIDIQGWTPDFRVEFPCGHSECNGSHTLLVEVKPYYTLDEFRDHPCTKYPYGRAMYGDEIPADASAAFGINPRVTKWEMSHGPGGVDSSVAWALDSICDIDWLWKHAGNVIQWKKS